MITCFPKRAEVSSRAPSSPASNWTAEPTWTYLNFRLIGPYLDHQWSPWLQRRLEGKIQIHQSATQRPWWTCRRTCSAVLGLFLRARRPKWMATRVSETCLQRGSKVGLWPIVKLPSPAPITLKVESLSSWRWPIRKQRKRCASHLPSFPPQLIGSAQVSFAIQCHQLLLHGSAPWCSPDLRGCHMLTISTSLVEGFTRLTEGCTKGFTKGTKWPVLCDICDTIAACAALPLGFPKGGEGIGDSTCENVPSPSETSKKT